ncbi:MAG: DUF2778 domain-containing protein [Alphaproteobacteria bacterium]|nr:DUF2778 domain-containing protein [Alphaproteobacteria bacterium]
MKKVFLAIFSLFLCLSAHADGDPQIMIFELNGKAYYLTDEKLLEALIKSETCIQGASEGEIAKLYLLLYDACKQSIAALSEEAREQGINPHTRFNNFMRNIGTKIATSNFAKQIGLSETDKETILRTGLKNCLITKESLTKRLTQNSKMHPTVTTKITADIDKCISNIGILPPIKNDICPLYPSVPDEKYIENIFNLNATYSTQTFHFPTDTPISTNKIIIFNGNVLVACENNIPKYLVRPTYSGRESCQNGQYQSIPYSGGTPNGVYVVRAKDKDTLSKEKQLAWGQYRIPLIPANETNTFGRTNMYLHGTTDPNKHRSGGCISLGLAIDEFVETNFIDSTIPIIVDVDTVYQDWNN